MPPIPFLRRKLDKLCVPVSPLSRFSSAAARAFVPFYGPAIARHIANFSVLDAHFSPLSWPRPNERVWILSPHPDDESLGCGGLLARCAVANVPAKIVFLTGGDGTRTTQFVLRVNPRFSGPYDLLSIAHERQIEAKNAARELGLREETIEFLGFPDGGMETMWETGFSPRDPYISPFTAKMRVPYENARTPHAPFCRQSVLDALVASLEEFQPTLVLTTPAFDTHRDHVASFQFLKCALACAELEHKPDFWIYLIHHGIWPVPNGLHPEKRLVPPAHLLRDAAWHSLELSDDEIEAKRRALACHATQMASTCRYLNAFVRQNELFAPASEF
ncbi:1D-myo-inositol 2-acetamido-2-deoxy-alpha-D-glucopyranoside deacetylase [Abditibacteriota bacterium]|nr:1D-myo-inositol 2-acetamido-2-deoxy-alpha-D-glucopyranoside deacetylase [Abditibacteriota bacterium]